MKTGKLIEAIMQYKHIGVEDLAKKIKIAQPNMAALIIGKRKITPQLAQKIGKALDIDAIVLLTNRTMDDLKALQ